MPPRYDTTAYRYPGESLILTGTLSLVFLVIVLTASATFCTSAVFILIAFALAYYSTLSHHQGLMSSARTISAQKTPVLAGVVRRCAARLGASGARIYVAPSATLNAYTFGLSDPKVVVLYSALLKVMDEDELAFILRHELGHVRLGHTWLNSLVGGMAGIPSSSSASALLTMAFLGWNRACEYSADRAGLLACGRLDKAVTALIKLVAGPAGSTQAGLELAYRQIDTEDDTWLGSLGEALGSHPLLIKRINQLRRYAATGQYRRLQKQIDQNG
ncbi:MAG: M48 family metallopeptidase [Anaerolineales bacterium]|nr:M48 family metallopeptidase [Anaerolineales bacterium]